MKRLILNPYDKFEEHKCFACSKHNLIGLQMSFYEEGDFVVSEWQPRPEFQGYHNVLHGGIHATLMDEISSWCIQIKLKSSGLTSRLETKYKHPVFCDKGKIKLKAKIDDFYKNVAKVHVQLFDSEDQLCSETVAKFIVFPLEIAKKNFHYPEYESFFKQLPDGNDSV
ncbi:MAG: PaaI family thioesterase [Bacteroidetes bacterium]|nr:PaaI family thioesterase [Bacteroidota bacterium]